VLGTISRSVFDLDAVLRTVIENAIRLAGADNGTIRRSLSGVEGLVHAGHFADAAHFQELVARSPGLTPGRSSLTGRVLLEGKSVQIPDVLADPDYDLTAESQGAS